MKKIILGILLTVSSLISGEISIAVATNLSYAIEPLKKAFKEIYPDTNINVTLGSSGKLTAQITHGAPYQLFMSANMKYPNNLYDNNLTVTKPIIYAQSALAILSTKERNYCGEIFVLKAPDIKKIAIANPKTTLCGVASVEALKNARLYKKLQQKFVYGDSISQTVNYAIDAADIGIIAKSSLFSPQMLKYKEAIHWTDVDGRLYTPIDQGMVILKKGDNNPEVKAYYEFMMSEKAKEILELFGYKIL